MSGSRTAVVLLSGGLDSAVVLAHMRAEGFRAIALSFDYGQRHRVELEAARALAGELGAAEHIIQRIDLRAFGGSALTSEAAVPKDRDETAMASDIPVTYVPARNTIFLAFALALAEARGAHDLAIGVNALDYSGYPDCRPAFVEAFERLANLATREGVEGRAIRIHTPLLHMTKREIVLEAQRLGVPVERTFSCYDPRPDGSACAHCDACVLRAKGIAQARG